MEAREELILSRQTHLHQLVGKLQEERVRRVVAPTLSGESSSGTGKASPNDVEYVRDLSLVARRGRRRIANPIPGGDQYALGSRRTDLPIVWPPGRFAGAAEPGVPARRYVVEYKILRGSLEATIREGLERTLTYMDKCYAESGHLVIFDRTSRGRGRRRSSAAKSRWAAGP